jgi:cobalamin biosynthesis Mg chelatase CobN
MKSLLKHSLIAALLLLVITMLSTGCAFQFKKAKRSLTTDSTSVKRLDIKTSDTTAQGAVHKQETTTKENNEWFRMLIPLLNQKGGDTTINNFISQPGQQQRPYIIYEGGKGSKEQTTNTVDSSWFNQMKLMQQNMLDSMNAKMTKTSTDKSSSAGISLMTLILVGLAFLVINFGIGYFKNKYSITKK